MMAHPEPETCEATSVTGQPCRVEGPHPLHVAGYGLDGREEWVNTEFVDPRHTKTSGSRDKTAQLAARITASEKGITLPAPETKQAQVYAYLVDRGERGATDKEMEEHFATQPGWAPGSVHETLSGRRRTLVKNGLVYDSGLKRRSPAGRDVIVWLALDLDTPDNVRPITEAPSYTPPEPAAPTSLRNFD